MVPVFAFRCSSVPPRLPGSYSAFPCRDLPFLRDQRPPGQPPPGPQAREGSLESRSPALSGRRATARAREPCLKPSPSPDCSATLHTAWRGAAGNPPDGQSATRTCTEARGIRGLPAAAAGVDRAGGRSIPLPPIDFRPRPSGSPILRYISWTSRSNTAKRISSLAGK